MTKTWMQPRIVARLFAVLFCCAAVSAPLYAQNNKGAIVGTVTDPNGAAVTGARVTATNLATNTPSEPVTTDDDGAYSIPNLVPGDYRVTFEGTGFQTLAREPVKLETNARLPIDAQLTIGGVGGDVVTVTGEGPVVESETSVRGDLITGREVTDLPIPQRNFTLLAALSPGVTRPSGLGVLGGGGNFASGGPGSSTESTRFRESGGSVLSVNGARPTNNNFTLDGVDNNESQFGQIATYPPPDAIAEFKIETSVPSAESGRAGGAIISTTYKSGGNEVHGTGFEFYQGRFASAAAAQFDETNSPPDPRTRIRRTPPNYVTHNFGGVIGGPIFFPRFGEGGRSLYDGRNRSFFFFSYAGQRNGTPAFGGGEFPCVTVPTARQRAGDCGELLTGGMQNYTFVNPNGTTRQAMFPTGTIFDRNGTPVPGNDLRRLGTPLSTFGTNFLNAYPQPTVSGLQNNFRRNRAERSNQDQYDIKIDHRITENNSIFGRYSRGKNVRIRDNNFPLGTSPNGNDLPSGFGAGEEFGNSRGLTLGDTQTFSPTVINDARFGINRVEIGINNPGINGALGFNPSVSANLGARNVNVCGTCEGAVLLGVVDNNSLEFIGDGGPFYFVSNNFNFADALTVVRGSQAFKFGGDLRVRQNSNFDGGRNGGIKGNVVYGTSAGGFSSGNYQGIGANDSGSALANVLLGYTPGQITRGTPGGPYFQSNKEIAFFAQDDWKVRSDLTLNLGLRYDVFTQPTERFDRQVNFNPATRQLVRAGDNAPGGRDLAETDRNNFGPRIGFAYSGFRSDKKLVLRGGYGLLYATDVSGQQPLTSNPGTGANNYGCSPLTGFSNCPSSLPRNFNLDTGYPLPSDAATIQPGQTLAVPGGSNVLYIDPNVRNAMFHQYNLTLQYEFAPNWLAEAGYVGNKGRNLLVVRNLGTSNNGNPGSRQVTGIDTVTATEYTGESNYDSLQTKVEKRFSRGLSILSAYTYAHAIDNSPGGFCIGGTGPSSCGPQNPLRPELDRGNSSLDVRHRFTFANVYDLPFGRGRRYGSDIPGVLDFFLGGFQLNNIISIQSGQPFNVTANGRRADLIGDPTPTAQQRARGLEFNPAAFRAAVTPIFANDPNGPKFGTLGRNVFRGQRQEFWDASLFKNFRVPSISEAFNVQFRVQAFNVLNHVNRSSPRSDLSDNLIGTDTSEQRRRQLEFSLKLLF